ncbi:unnamed protein product [Rotaria socialis]|uniref:Uncharacterized protein n=1 Tax=Rotaria socialis TaxID=392032 RepID=A0A820YKN8_9BILA|nr:unnamed protein product [Rotaria socialis]CAF4614317.1 unnamed protein product [Rotaria socialis]
MECFKKEGCCYSTVYRVIQRYVQFKVTTDLPRSGRPRKLNNKQMKSIAFTVNNNSGISHRILSRRYNVDHRTIGRNLKQRTHIRPRQRIKAPKYVKDQEKRAQKYSGFLYRHISNNCFIVMDGEKYFSLSGVDIPGNSLYYTSDRSSTPANINSIGQRMFTVIYIYKTNNAVTGDVYLKQCIQRRLIPFIKTNHLKTKFIFWPDLAKAHYTPQVLRVLEANSIPFVPKEKNPPNVPQVRPIEDLWGILKQMVYAQNYEAKNFDQLASRIRKKFEN